MEYVFGYPFGTFPSFVLSLQATNYLLIKVLTSPFSTHTPMLHSSSIILRFTLFFLLLSTGTASAQTAYQMAGPYEVIARDGEFRHTKG